MRTRFLFAAAVVGALFAGGATTGGTDASWVDTQAMASGSLQSALMKFTGTLSPTDRQTLTKNSSTATGINLTLTDTSTPGAKNLLQNISLTAATAPTGIKLAVTSGVCPTTVAVPTVDANSYTAANIAQTTYLSTTKSVCVALLAGSATTAVGNQDVTLTLKGQQIRPGNVSLTNGLTFDHSTLTIPVNIGTAPAPTSVTCSFSGSTATLGWATVGTGYQYRVYEVSGTTATLVKDNINALSTTITQGTLPNNSSLAVRAFQTSSPSVESANGSPVVGVQFSAKKCL